MLKCERDYLILVKNRFDAGLTPFQIYIDSSDEVFAVVESLDKKVSYIRDHLKNDYNAIVEGFQIGSVSTDIMV
jgi:hypothetical protein